MVKTLHLTSSRFFGGPERQMLGLAAAGRELFSTSFASFSENGLCRDFLARAESVGFPSIELANDTPHLLKAVREIRQLIRDQGIDVLLCHGYKAGLAGWRAARKAGIPVIAVSRGWTGENRKVRFYEWLDRKVLRQMDHVVCVSQSQAQKVRRCGVPVARIALIPNSIDMSRFKADSSDARDRIEIFFPETKPQFIIGAIGRLSPEKGFSNLVSAVGEIIRKHPHVGLLIFGEGDVRSALESQIAELGMESCIKLPGFRLDLDQILPGLDVLAQASFTEGMPNVVLEALAAGVPVVATAVGGTPEIIESGKNGHLVHPHDVRSLRDGLVNVLENPQRAKQMADTGRMRLEQSYGFQAQVDRYSDLLEKLLGGSHSAGPGFLVSAPSQP